jgi:hypothetical protein
LNLKAATLPDPRILVLGTASNAAQPEDVLARLDRIALPNVSKHVATAGKFDSRGIAATLNVEAGYPAEPAVLHTLAAWAERQDPADPRFRDGYDLFCFRRLLANGVEGDLGLIVRGDCELESIWPELREKLAGQLFVTFPSDTAHFPSIFFDLNDPEAPAFLDLAWESYLSGSVYAMDPYSLQRALTAASDALRLQVSI